MLTALAIRGETAPLFSILDISSSHLQSVRQLETAGQGTKTRLQDPKRGSSPGLIDHGVLRNSVPHDLKPSLSCSPFPGPPIRAITRLKR
ncbi:hypothetical protein [Paraburkholderia sp. D1E]|uniref:hypothetical protein n=1 Tax=Paraburkholderia sp. D1E TaxID=3461398 RepID=UPI004045B408